MVDTPKRLSPLHAEFRAGDFGAARSGNVLLGERRGLSMVQVETAPDGAADLRARLRQEFSLELPATPNTSTGDETFRMIWAGPERWLLVDPESRDLEAHVFGVLRDVEAAVVDLSHARGVIRLGGPNARQVLAKGAGLDFHERVFTTDNAAQTVLFHVSVLLDCTGPEQVFDIYAARGFCLNLWQSLCHASAEYGYRVS